MRPWQIVLTISAISLAGIGLWLYSPDKTSAELAPKYLRAPTDFIDVAGLRLRIRDDGPRAAPAVIMLHGFGASLHTWEPWATALAAQMRVIRFDLPGFGLTGADPSGNYSDERSLEIIVGLMDKLGLARQPDRQFDRRQNRLEICSDASCTHRSLGVDFARRLCKPKL